MRLFHHRAAPGRVLIWLLAIGMGYTFCSVSVTGKTLYGPHPAAESTRVSRHAYSPFEQLERKRQEELMPKPEWVAHRVLIKMADEAGVAARAASAAKEALSIDGLESLERLFPRAKGKPKSSASSSGTTTKRVNRNLP